MKTNFNLNQLVPVFAVLIILFALAGAWLTISTQQTAAQALSNYLQRAPSATPTPAVLGGLPKLSVTLVEVSSCKDCANLTTLLEGIRSLEAEVVNANTFQYTDAEAKVFLQKYNVTRVPAAFVQGDTGNENLTGVWTSAQASVREDGTVVFEPPQPPYVVVGTGETVGKVVLTLLVDEQCALCFDYSTASTQFKTIGMLISEEKTIEYNSSEGRALVNQYNITKVPTILLSKDAWEYKAITQGWPSLGSHETDGTLVLREVNPPYRNLESGEVKGLVSMVSITDSECASCYDVSIHKQLMERLGLVFKNENTYDAVNLQGKQYLERYNITKVPTFLLSPEAGIYPAIKSIWEQLGTNETDGWFVFRNMEALPNLTHHDLLTDKIIVPNATTTD